MSMNTSKMKIKLPIYLTLYPCFLFLLYSTSQCLYFPTLDLIQMPHYMSKIDPTDLSWNIVSLFSWHKMK